MNITAILLHLVPGAQFTCYDNNPDRIIWHPANPAPCPTRSEIEAAWPAVQSALAAGAQDAAARQKLVEIDLSSVRALREYLAARPDAPQALKDREAEAAAERAKLLIHKVRDK
ncbi:MAG: hypothetical protein JNM76_14565 [Betaproteobacteria bacterium]|nr:hypothetical protein [Betaproteobacteria bacterium]